MRFSSYRDRYDAVVQDTDKAAGYIWRGLTMRDGVGEPFSGAATSVKLRKRMVRALMKDLSGQSDSRSRGPR